MERSYLLKLLHAQININGHIIGAAVGSGMTAKCAVMGGADFLLALSAGKYRIMGRSSHACYFCYGNNNEIVMDMGIHELLPIIKDVPVLFGLLANDPGISLYEYLKEIKSNGFSGIVNFPTMGLIDGQFREALEEEGNSFDREVEAVKLAHYLDLFTLAFVTNMEETRQMLEAGADVICVHLGLTKGGFLGAKKYISIEAARRMIVRMFQLCREVNPDAIRMIYAGPVNTPIDMQYMYKNTECQGYIGGSTFDRIPTERAILNTTKAFKTGGSFEKDNLMSKILSGGWNPRDYSEFVKQYIEEHYMNEIQLENLALVAHISPSYLSSRFKKEVGMSFTEYLIRYRLDKAKEQLRTSTDSCRQVAENVGYMDYVQFSKIFKKYEGVSPTEYREISRNA
ncbi:MAG: helix-turn-helix domain-containing protein [Lachnospiraceae bacterium]|nr:helix-turn-helix domain-containing protein [Lachnospiraceae bacterium]